MFQMKANPRINEIIDAYMEDVRNEFGQRVRLTADSIEAHFKPIRSVWGDMRYAEFVQGSRKRVEDQYKVWRRGDAANGIRPQSQGTCRKRLSQFRTALNFAYRRELIEKVPLFDLPPPSPPRERFVDSEKELPSLLYEADDPRTPYHIKLQTELLLRLGCRKGALLKLKWEHVDFENRVVRLRDTQTAAERVGNKKKRENQAICDDLFKLLMEAKERAKSEYVIEWRGKPVRSSYRGQKSLYRRAGLKNLTVHDLRRSSATMVHNELGGDLEAAARHIADTKEMAQRVYIQQDPKIKLPGLRAISSVIAKARRA